MIEVKNLTKRLHDFTALEDVSCSIGSGCIYGMVGSNGAGKSTFLRALTGVYQPDAGKILIDGQPVWDNPAVKRRIAYVPDELYFLAGANLNRMERMYQSLYPDFDKKIVSKSCAVIYSCPGTNPWDSSPRECAARRRPSWRCPAARTICSSTRPSTVWIR